MQALPAALHAMGAYKQFVIYKIVPSRTRPGKTDKFPVNPATLSVSDAHDPSIWVDSTTAINSAAMCGPGWGVGFVFTDNDPFWFLDLDDCLGADGQWSPVAQELCGIFNGAAVEISQSGRGLHIFGSGQISDHGCTNKAQGLELYHNGRFAALTGTGAVGDATVDMTAVLPGVVSRYFPPVEKGTVEEWRDTPVPEWKGAADDTILIGKARNSVSAGQAFGKGVTFADLWDNNEGALGGAFPSQNDVDPYDRSSADASLAQRLAFWTGNNHARIESLMRQSGLVREKWDRHPSYMQMTVSGAVGRQVEVCGGNREAKPAPTAQQPTGDAQVTPVHRIEVEYTSGIQLLTHNQLVDLFEGCIYVRDQHRMFTPDGSLLKPEQFKAMYGGYTFGLDADNSKTTRNAYEAFTECQAVRFPKVSGTCFRPEIPSGSVIEEENRTLLNTYVPINTKRTPGDPTRFINHIHAMLPKGDDALIILCYMAALVQNPGIKFQWAPLIQGAEGNGKSFISRAVAHAVGHRYTHLPKASDIGNKFNAWVEGKLFASIEEIYVPDRRELLEEMKTLITNDRIPIQPKGIDQYTADNYVNFIINSNHKDGIPITLDMRRYAPFYCAQQSRLDINRDFPGKHLKQLHTWLKYESGYEIFNEYLRTYQIDERYNPAGDCADAPRTSSSGEAADLSLGGVEQEIVEAIDEGRAGFAGGWVSGKAIDKLLTQLRAERRIPQNKRRALMQSLGYDWHPALPKGRVNNIIAIEGGKPKLYVKTGHIHSNLRTCAEVVRCYSEAQGYPAMLSGAMGEV